MYIFYLDESGQREYGKGTSRYFVLSALSIHEDQWKDVSLAIDEIKRTYFDTVNVEIKSNWLRNPIERDRRYLKPYTITQEKLAEFGKKIHSFIEVSEITVLASVIDKLQMQEEYKSPQSPSSRAYIHLFERIELFLRNIHDGNHGLLVFDKINDTNFQRRGYENLLTRQHRRYLVEGTDYVRVDRIVEGLFFIPSSENNLIQLSDMIAYDIYRQFHDFGSEWDLGEPGSKEFKTYYQYFERIKHLIYTSQDGRLDGYGIKKFPEVQATSRNI